MGWNRFQIVSIVILLAAANAFAVPTTQPSDVEAARRRLADAEARLTQIQKDKEDARRNRDDANARGYVLQQGNFYSGDRLNDLSAQLMQANSGADLAARDTESMAALLQEIAAALEPAKAELNAAILAVSEARGGAKKAFENGAELAAVNQQIRVAQDALKDEIQDIVTALEEEPAYQKLQDAADVEQSHLQQVRAARPIDQKALSAASTRWLAAAAALESFKSEIVLRDFFVVATKKEIAAAQAAKVAMIKKFDADLQKDPVVAHAVANVAARKAAVNRIGSDYVQVSQNLGAARAAVRSWTDAAQRAQRDYDNEQSRVDGINFAVDQAWQDEQRYHSIFRRTERDEQLAQRERDDAARALQIALGNQPNTPGNPNPPGTPGTPNTPPTTQTAGGKNHPVIPPNLDDPPRRSPAPRYKNPKDPRRIPDNVDSQVADAAPVGSGTDSSVSDPSRGAQTGQNDSQQTAQNARQAQIDQQRAAAAAQNAERVAQQAQRTAEQTQARAEQAQRTQQQNQSRADAAKEEMERKAAERRGGK